MKRFPPASALMFAAMTLHAQEVSIAPFHDNKAAAISYTFDDGLREDYTKAIGMLEERGFRGTFFIIAATPKETVAEAEAERPGGYGGLAWPEIREMAQRGHEIGSHTLNHKQLTKLTDAEVETEIDQADEIIKDKAGVIPLTICYPGNGRNDKIREMALQRHLVDRTFQFGFGGPQFTLEQANAWVDGLIAQRKWGVTMIHGITVGYQPMATPDLLPKHFDYVKAHQDQVWVDTFLNVGAYVRERDAATVDVTKRGDKEVTFTLGTHVPPDPSGLEYPHPALTLVVQAPGATSATVTQGRVEIPSKVKDGMVTFDAKPGPEPIAVAWNKG